MNKSIIISLLAIIVLIIGFVLVSGSNSTSTNENTSDLTITDVEIIEEDAVYVTLSNDERRQIAEFVPFEEDNFKEVRYYRSYEISPDKKYVAIDGTAFEEGITQVYAVENDTLYNTTTDTLIYGQIDSWTNAGLLLVESCDLANENCVNKISVSADQPWVVQEVSNTVVEPDNQSSNNNSSNNQGFFDSSETFITNINNDDNLTEFGELLEEYAPRAIGGTGPFTVFAPTNEALSGVIPTDATDDEIIDFIRNHVAAPEYRFGEFSADEPINTTGNDRLSFVRQSGVVRINNRANIVRPDLESSNGFVHVIDDTVIPLNR